MTCRFAVAPISDLLMVALLKKLCKAAVFFVDTVVNLSMPPTRADNDGPCFLPRSDDAIALIAALVDLKPVCFGPAASAPIMAAPPRSLPCVSTSGARTDSVSKSIPNSNARRSWHRSRLASTLNCPLHAVAVMVELSSSVGNRFLVLA